MVKNCHFVGAYLGDSFNGIFMSPVSPIFHIVSTVYLSNWLTESGYLYRILIAHKVVNWDLNAIIRQASVCQPTQNKQWATWHHYTLVIFKMMPCNLMLIAILNLNALDVGYSDKSRFWGFNIRLPTIIILSFSKVELF